VLLAANPQNKFDVHEYANDSSGNPIPTTRTWELPDSFAVGTWYRLVLDVAITANGDGSKVTVSAAERGQTPRVVVDGALAPTLVTQHAAVILTVGLAYIKAPTTAQIAVFDDLTFDWKR